MSVFALNEHSVLRCKFPHDPTRPNASHLNHVTDSFESEEPDGSDGVSDAARGLLVSDLDEKYRRYAAEAQLQADKAISAQDKESWLKIARSWLEMLPKRLRSAEDQFNDKVRDLGTGQEESGSMN